MEFENIKREAWGRLLDEARALTHGQELAKVSPFQRRKVAELITQGVKSHTGEFNRWITAHEDWLQVNYPHERAAWLYSFRVVACETGGYNGPKVAKEYAKYPWGEYFFTIMGQPPEAWQYEDQLWFVCLQVLYFRYMKAYRTQFEKRFKADHMGHVFQSGADAWKVWHFGVAHFGIDHMADEWNMNEIERVLTYA
jgi:hypothetical protein